APLAWKAGVAQRRRDRRSPRAVAAAAVDGIDGLFELALRRWPRVAPLCRPPHRVAADELLALGGHVGPRVGSAAALVGLSAATPPPPNANEGNASPGLSPQYQGNSQGAPHSQPPPGYTSQPPAYSSQPPPYASQQLPVYSSQQLPASAMSSQQLAQVGPHSD